MDVKTAFLYPKLKEMVYILPLEGYAKFLPAQRLISKLLKLLKCLYGPKQSPHEWYNEIDRFSRAVAFKCSEQDPNLYISQDIMILLYVDNIVIFGRFLNSM